MTVGFMSLVTVVISETLNVAGPELLLSLILVGVSSVMYWAVFDDLRFYALVQFFSVASVPLLFGLFPSRYTGAVWQDFLVKQSAPFGSVPVSAFVLATRAEYQASYSSDRS